MQIKTTGDTTTPTLGCLKLKRLVIPRVDKDVGQVVFPTQLIGIETGTIAVENHLINLLEYR